MLFLVDDGNCAVKIDAPTSYEAAKIYVESGDWHSCNETWWCKVHTWQEDHSDEESHLIAVDPKEPRCKESQHEWHSPHSIVGGLKENPGVFGHGGGVIIVEICKHCGLTKTTDTWAQCRATGIEGLVSVKYVV